MTDYRHAHRTALAVATEYVNRVGPADLSRPTPCAEWDLAALLAHMVGQHEGFAAAVRAGDAPESAYHPVAFTAQRWDESVAELLAAFIAADLDAQVVEVELSPTPLPVEFLVTAQFLDTVVHTWDVAQSFGESYEPPAEVAEQMLRIATNIPDDERRERPGAAFAHARTDKGSPWQQALALLGREPN